MGKKLWLFITLMIFTISCGEVLAKATNSCDGVCISFDQQAFATQAIKLFTSDKPNMSKLNGRVVYSREHDAYVLFSYSPQYAYWQADRVGAEFMVSMGMLKKILKK